MCNSSPTKLGTVIVPPTSFNPSGKAGSQLAGSCGGIQRHQNLPKEENKQSERGGKQSLPTTQEPLALAVLAPSASGCSASNTWTITPLRGFAVLLQSPQTDWYPFHSSACCLWMTTHHLHPRSLWFTSESDRDANSFPGKPPACLPNIIGTILGNAFHRSENVAYGTSRVQDAQL